MDAFISLQHKSLYSVYVKVTCTTWVITMHEFCELNIPHICQFQHANMQKGKTPLHHMANKGSKECVKLLVHEYRADPEEVDIVSATG